MSILNIPTARAFLPLLEPARYKGAYGGRGSGKSHFFAGGLVEDAVRLSGLRAVCIREVQKSLKDSAKKLIEDKIQEMGLGSRFEVYHDHIKTPGDGLIIFQGMQDHTAESIKSLEGFDRAWVEEAQTLSSESLKLLRPTIRKEGSELWFSWNPRRKTDPVDVMFRQSTPPTGAVCVKANWNDNPWFPKVLEQERLDCLEADPDQYDHIWEGGYVTVAEGAYFARHLAEAKGQGRIGRLSPDPLMTIRLFADIGGTGARADAFVFWAAQFVGQEIRVLDHYEVQGQPLEAHLDWLRSKGYTPEKAQIWLPHDGGTQDRVYSVSYESAFKSAGYKVTVIPNQGKGAASKRIEEVRRLFPQIWFNADTTEAGREALGWYHEKKDEVRNIGLGPEHDWSSHSCLVAGSVVKTRGGPVPVESVRAGDEVFTPAGWASVAWAGQVKVADRLVRITLASGESLTMTPEHKVFTTRGLVPAVALRYNDAVINTEDAPCLKLESASRIGYRAAFTESFGATGFGIGRSAGCMRARKAGGFACCIVRHLETALMRLSPLMAIGTTLPLKTGSVGLATPAGRSGQSIRFKSLTGANTTAQIMGITPGDTQKLSLCIEWCGRSTTAKFPMGITSITSMVTRLTTVLRTLSLFQLRSIRATTRKKASGLAVMPTGVSLPKRHEKQRSGIAARKAGNGTLSMEQSRGRAGSLLRLFAKFAGRLTRRTSHQGQSIAGKVARIEWLTGGVPVYDLTVPHHHCYYANGLLVSNSDAFGLMCVAHETPKGKMKPINFSGWAA